MGKRFYACFLTIALILGSLGIKPTQVQAAAKKVVTVATQKQLDQAVANEKVGTILISSTKKVKLVIKNEVVGEKELIVDAENATVTNKATFASITVKSAKKYVEAGKDNKLTFTQDNGNIVIDKNAQVNKIYNKSSDTCITVRGKVSNLISQGENTKVVVGMNAVVTNMSTNDSKVVIYVRPNATVENTTVKGKTALIKVASNAEVTALNLQNTATRLNTVKDSTVNAVNVNKENAKLVLNNAGTANVNVQKKANMIVTLDSDVKITLNKGAEDSKIKTTGSANIDVMNKTDKDVTVTTNQGEVIVNQGKNATVNKEDKVTPTPTVAPSTSDSYVPSTTDTHIAVNAEGFDAKGRMVANFGTPKIDGDVDEVWNKAIAVKAPSSAATTTTVEFKTLWDDNALYVLANVKDSDIDTSAANAYEKDSMELFFDEKNDGKGPYDSDDLHFRVNAKNEHSSDNGDLIRFNTATKATADGYVIEARIAWADGVPANSREYGFDLQINDAKGGTRIATMQVFDQTGMAYDNTSLFGKLVLADKREGDVSGLNTYDLQNLVASTKNTKETLILDLNRYTNGDIAKDLIAKAEAAIDKPDVTQAEIDDLYTKLTDAIDNLQHNDTVYDTLEMREIPKKYQATDPNGGTVVEETYTYDGYDKKMLVYLPNGYDAADTATKYNILYLIHGMGENQTTLFGGAGQDTVFKKMIDHMISDGKIGKMIIVAPTWDKGDGKGTGSDVMFGLTQAFPTELTGTVLPLIESKYNVYAEGTTEEQLVAARTHRAVGGFSMGASTTWNTFATQTKFFKYYVPLCLASQLSVPAGFDGATDKDRCAQYLESIIYNAGLTPADVYIYGATGTEDSRSATDMPPQMEAMATTTKNTFIRSANPEKGNFYFMLLTGGTHTWNCASRYLYNLLPNLFSDKKLDASTWTMPCKLTLIYDDGTENTVLYKHAGATYQLSQDVANRLGTKRTGWKDEENTQVNENYTITKDTILTAVNETKLIKPSVNVATSGAFVSSTDSNPIKVGVCVSGAAFTLNEEKEVVVASGEALDLKVIRNNTSLSTNYAVQYAIIANGPVPDEEWKNIAFEEIVTPIIFWGMHFGDSISYEFSLTKDITEDSKIFFRVIPIDNDTLEASDVVTAAMPE